METTIIYWGYIRIIMEKTNGNWYSIFGVIFGCFLGGSVRNLGTRVYGEFCRDYMGNTFP